MQENLATSFESLVDKLNNWVDIIILNLPNLLIATLVFCVSYFLAVKVRKSLNKILSNSIKQLSVRHLIANISAIVLISIGLFLALGILNLDKALTSLLAGAGVAGLAIGLALQGTLSNVFSGVVLALKEIINVGDFIETNGYSGTVEEISLRYIKLKEPDNNIVIIPNKTIVENPFKNYGLTTQVRATVQCGVGYESDLEMVRDLAISTIENEFPVPEEQPIEFHYLEFGDSSINFQIRFWVDATSKLTMLEVRSKAIIAIKKAFDKHNINIPFPIRTLQFENKLELTKQTAEMQN